MMSEVCNSACFSPSHLSRIKETMTRQKFKRGAAIFWDDEKADRWFYIFKGKVKVTKPSDEGKEFILHLFQEGDFFGQAYPRDGGKYLFKAEALEDTELGIMHAEELETMFLNDASLAHEYIQWLERIRLTTVTKLRDLMLYGKTGALCSTLIRLANTCGVPDPRGIRIATKFTNVDMADYVGCARESVSRMISDLKHKGVISIEDGHILIHDLDYLKEMCRCEHCPKEVCRM